GARVPTGGLQQSLAKRDVHQETLNQDIGFNFKYAPDDNWKFNFDAQYTEASTDNLDVSVFGSTFADQMLDLRGNIPVLVATKPQNTRATWATPTEMDNLSDQEYFSSNRYTFWRAAMDHIEQSDGAEWAFRGDAEYDFGPDSFIKRFKVGVRYSDRDQTVRSTTYNWGRLSEVWGGNSGSAVFFDEFGSDQTAFYDFDNFFRGATPGPVGGWYYTGDLVDDYEGSSDFLDSVEQFYRFGQDGAAGGGVGWQRLADRPNAIAGTPFLPSDIQVVSEDTKAAYLMVSFGNDEYEDYPNISGNVGVRLVQTGLNSDGSIQFPQANAVGGGDPFEDTCDPNPPNAPPGGLNLPAECDLPPEVYAAAQQFTDGSFVPEIVDRSYTDWMPSLNMRLSLSPEVQFRFAVSRAMARPDFRYTRNFLTIGVNRDAGFRFQANAGNPHLDPAKATQFDLTAEWYFDDVGSLTATAFYKTVSDFFYDAVELRQMTNNGVTMPVFVRGPQNFRDDNGTVKGIELAYQQTYDFLPAPFDGLGFSGNYTYIESKGVPNAVIGGDLENPGQDSNLQAGNLPLEQLSKHNVNATLFYEKGPISVRASYNWRSRFLLTARDVIFPYYPVFNDDTGQLDASIFYSVTDNIKLAVQGTNLLNEVTTTLQQFTADGLIGPRSYFVNDRRISFGVRASW
ncbi:MAG TPA: TonB-dependent receptor, partial [Alteraurantiacibacter sp.]